MSAPTDRDVAEARRLIGGRCIRGAEPRMLAEALAAARAEGFREGVLRTMRLVTRVVERAPWGEGDPLAIRDDLLRALEPGAEVPS